MSDTLTTTHHKALMVLYLDQNNKTQYRLLSCVTSTTDKIYAMTEGYSTEDGCFSVDLTLLKKPLEQDNCMLYHVVGGKWDHTVSITLPVGAELHLLHIFKCNTPAYDFFARLHRETEKQQKMVLARFFIDNEVPLH